MTTVYSASPSINSRHRLRWTDEEEEEEEEELRLSEKKSWSVLSLADNQVGLRLTLHTYQIRV